MLPQVKSTKTSQNKSSLRRKVLGFVCSLVVLSLLGSTISLYRITEVNQLLESINKFSVPLGRVFGHLQTDAEVYQREVERNLGASHWQDPHWKAKRVPRWIQDVLDEEVSRINSLIADPKAFVATPQERRIWESWGESIYAGLGKLRVDSVKLFSALESGDEDEAMQIYLHFNATAAEWRRQVTWGTEEFERLMRGTFTVAQKRVGELRTGLEVILAGVVCLSLLILWLGERALRPLEDLTELVRRIADRGLKKEDKAELPELSIVRNDEVGELAVEFHRMATILLEREKTVEIQKSKLEEQYRLLKTMGQLNENVLNSIDSILIVTDLYGRITQANPSATVWLLDGTMQVVVGTDLFFWPKLRPFVQKGVQNWFEEIQKREEAFKIDPVQVEGAVLSGQVMALRDDSAKACGLILVLEDLTEEYALEERVRQAENLAAVGRLSAQVAHEVRNPLHSIGLEAEIALELIQKELVQNKGTPELKQSLQSILSSVERLEKITANYLKLTRLSSGENTYMDVGVCVENALATYATMCENADIEVDWSRQPKADLRMVGDKDLLEQAFGNLLKNSIQSLENKADDRKISVTMGMAESGRIWLSFQDNGPGVVVDVMPKLFRPFVTTKTEGTGLGLSFVKKVIEDHGGEISYRTVSQGGACFELTLRTDIGPLLMAMPTPMLEEEHNA